LNDLSFLEAPSEGHATLLGIRDDSIRSVNANLDLAILTSNLE
jgi:hypothetical protein